MLAGVCWFQQATGYRLHLSTSWGTGGNRQGQSAPSKISQEPVSTAEACALPGGQCPPYSEPEHGDAAACSPRAGQWPGPRQQEPVLSWGVGAGLLVLQHQAAGKASRPQSTGQGYPSPSVPGQAPQRPRELLSHQGALMQSHSRPRPEPHRGLGQQLA